MFVYWAIFMFEHRRWIQCGVWVLHRIECCFLVIVLLQMLHVYVIVSVPGPGFLSTSPDRSRREGAHETGSAWAGAEKTAVLGASCEAQG